MALPVVALLAPLLLSACRPPAAGDPAATTPCAEGEALLDGACVPEGCEVLPEGGDVTATPDTLADLVADPPGSVIVLPPGVYPAAFSLGGDADGLRLVGACREGVILQGDDTSSVVALDGRARVELAHLTVAGGLRPLAVSRGTLALEEVTVRDGLEMGIVAAGSRAEVELDRVAVLDTRQLDGRYGRGVDIEVGATLAADGLTLSGNHDVSLFLVDGAVATLSDVEVQDTRPLSAREGGRGVEVGLGASLDATRLRVDGSGDVALFAYGLATEVVLVESELVGTAPLEVGREVYGAQIVEGAFVSMTGGRVAENGGAGLLVDGAASLAILDGVEVSDNVSGSLDDPGGGVAVQAGADATLRGLSFERNAGLAVALRDPDSVIDGEDLVIRDTRIGPDGVGGEALYAAEGTLRATRVEVSDGQEHAVYARVGARVELEELQVDGTWTDEDARYGRGVNIQEQAVATCTGCILLGSHDVGVIADGPGTSVELWDSTVSGTRNASDTRSALGVAAQDGARVSGDGLVVADTEGPGLYAVTDAEIDCRGCTLQANGFANALVLDGWLRLTDTTLDGAMGDASSGGGVGVYADAAWGWPRVFLTDVSASGNRYAALWFAGNGHYEVRGGSFEGGEGSRVGRATLHGNAVYAAEGVLPWDGELGLLLEGTELAGSRVAVLLHGASGTLEEVAYEANGVDVQQQACDGAPAPVGAESAPTYSACPAVWDLVAPLEYGLRLVEVPPAP